MRLNFSGSDEDAIREGIRRIGEVVTEQVELYGTLTGEHQAVQVERAAGRGRQRAAAAQAVRPLPSGRGLVSRVAVLKGGRSLERQVSLRSGARVEDALERLGHDVVALDVGPDLISRLRDASPDVAFIAMHGRDGEDGTVQELLEILDIPYTGSGVLACVRATDKVLAKHLMIEAGIPTPEFFAFSETAFRELGAADALPAIEERLDFPIVVKPSSQGSALGIKFARKRRRRARGAGGRVLLRLARAARAARRRARPAPVSILDGEPLPVVEAVPAGDGFYDFEARYEIGRTEFVCPAELPDGVTEQAQELALQTYRLLGCSAFGRVDLMLGGDGELTVLEANPIPASPRRACCPRRPRPRGSRSTSWWAGSSSSRWSERRPRTGGAGRRPTPALPLLPLPRRPRPRRSPRA